MQRSIMSASSRLVLWLATGGLMAPFSMAAEPVRKPAAIKPAAEPKKPARCPVCDARLGDRGECQECAKNGRTKMASSDMRSSGRFVYALDNDVERNSVVVYRRQEDGSLMPLVGSPFNAGGRGLSGGDIDEQGAIRVVGPYVLAVNPGSDTIAVLEKTERGLLHVKGSPFPSGGSTPLSIAVHGDLVYVANQAAPFAQPKNEPNITGFRLSSDGRLMPLANSTVAFPKGEGPAQVEFNPQGAALLATAGFQTEGAEGSRVYSFKVAGDGRLIAGPDSPVKPNGSIGTVGFSWSKDGTLAYVSTFKGSAVVTVAVDPKTAAIKQVGMPTEDDQRAACWTAISSDGRTLYVGNFVSNSISVFDVEGSKLTLLGSIPRRGADTKDTKDIELSSDGKYLYAIGSGMRQLSIFRVEANRLLTELPGGQSPIQITTGQNTTGLVAD